MTELRLRDYLQAILRHKLAMVLVTVVTCLLGFLSSVAEEPTYVSTSAVQFSSEQESSPFLVGSEDRDERTFDLVTEIDLLKSSTMRAQVIEFLGPEAKPFGAVEPLGQPFSEIVRIRVEAPSPDGAADAATAYARLFVEQRLEESTGALLEQATELRRRSDDASIALSELEAQIAQSGRDPAVVAQAELERSSLSNQIFEFDRRANQLEVEASLRESATRLVSPGSVNLDPIAPKPLRTTVIALVLGLLAGVAVAVLLEIQQDRLRSAEELASIAPDLTLLASIPSVDEGAAQEGAGALPPAALEAYRYLRTSLRFRGVGSVVATSAVGAEGKSMTAVNLARTMAAAGDRVVLVDADIRRPSVHRRLGLPNDVGLTTVLSGDVSLEDAVHYAEPTLVALTAGPAAASTNPNEHLGGVAFGRLIESLRSQCDMLIVDAPPILPVADPLLAARLVDGAIVVVRIGGVKRREVRAALRRLEEAGLSVVGLVANGVEPGHYYAYEPEAEHEPAPGRRARRRASAL